MIDIKLLKKAFYDNFINTVLIALTFWSLNAKMNKILIKEGIHDVSFSELQKDVSDHEERIKLLERFYRMPIGDAYIRDEDDGL
jgi:hypothetical protein